MMTRPNHTLWTHVRQCEIPGQPVGKGRPRFYKRGRYTKVFTPEKTKKYEERVAVFAAGKCIPREVPVRIECLFIFQRPKRLMRRKDPDGLLLMTSKPDGDNVLKAVLDGLNGVAYQDDAQVTDSSFRKRYSEKDRGPRVVVNIYTAIPINNLSTRNQNPDDMAPSTERTDNGSSD